MNISSLIIALSPDLVYKFAKQYRGYNQEDR